MSKARRERQQAQQRKEDPPPSTLWRNLTIVLVIAAAFAAAYYLGVRKRNHRYDAFARCTFDRGARMYGAFWCPHCKEQEEAFGASFQYVNYVECGVKGDLKAQSQACKDAQIKHYPTWEFLDQSRVEGKQTFEYLSSQTGCPLP
jgi:hypothetical protein